MTYVDYSDDSLMDELSALIAQRDPIPALIATQARASYGFSSPWDAALAQLVYDSSDNDHDARALVRSGPVARELTFEGPALTVEVEVGLTELARRGRCRILGQLVPAQTASIQVRCPSETFMVDADSYGRFAVDDAPTGPLSLRCTPVDGEPTDTEWTVI